MNVVKCINGHFYDSDKNSKCPRCGESRILKEGFPAGKTGRKEKQKKKLSKKETPHAVEDFLNSKDRKKKVRSVSSGQNGLTQVLMEDAFDKPEPDFLQQEPENADAGTEDKTVGYFSRLYDKKDPSLKGQDHRTEPVTGWLVCIAGPHFGESFSIAAGNNSIGRGASNKIVLDRDPAVSGDKHAIIIYEPKNRKFYIQPGDSSGLTYLNETFLKETCELRSRAVIELGGSRFLFIPLCGPAFSWETYLE